jgi:hypothetical protein
MLDVGREVKSTCAQCVETRCYSRPSTVF